MSRALDALVAEQVMGWTVMDRAATAKWVSDRDRRKAAAIRVLPGWSVESNEALADLLEFQAGWADTTYVGYWYLVPKDEDAEPRDLPRYSSDLAAAWEVVEKMTMLRPDPSHRPYSVHVMASQGASACRITTWSVEGETTVALQMTKSVPEAICLAALKALHIPLPETV